MGAIVQVATAPLTEQDMEFEKNNAHKMPIRGQSHLNGFVENLSNPSPGARADHKLPKSQVEIFQKLVRTSESGLPLLGLRTILCTLTCVVSVCSCGTVCGQGRADVEQQNRAEEGLVGGGTVQAGNSSS